MVGAIKEADGVCYVMPTSASFSQMLAASKVNANDEAAEAHAGAGAGTGTGAGTSANTSVSAGTDAGADVGAGAGAGASKAVVTGTDELEGMEGDMAFELPNGKVISILAVERCTAAEVMFTPRLQGVEAPGLSEGLLYSVGKVDDEGVQIELLKNVVLVGGNTLFKGLGTRLENELNAIIADVVCNTCPKSLRHLQGRS
jgi:actin-related protein